MSVLRGSIIRAAAVMLAITIALPGGVFRKKKYENPITKDTQQPDKVLFDKSIHDIEKGRYEVARLTLNTLINTYDTSEFLAKAKLAIADSWFREGGSHGLAQAEAEYKDFILFYPTMEEAPEAQNRVCDIHIKQMEKSDRDTAQALRAEQECRLLMTQFPNSKFAPVAQQKLREIQEVLAENEMVVGTYYHKKGSNPAAANRLAGVVTQYPLYSGAADALWLQADSYSKMGKNFRGKAGESYQRIVRDYPLSRWTDPAKKKLKELEMDIPEADPVAVARMQYEKENYVKPGLMKNSLGFLSRGPDMSHAAKSGSPAMTTLKPSIPASVPIPAEAAPAGGTTDVTISTNPGKDTSLDTKPDARMSPPAASAAPATPVAGTEAATAPAAAKPSADAGPQPLPVNHTGAGKVKPMKTPKAKTDKKSKQSKTPPPSTPPADAAPKSQQL
jgi:outer membrane protein assembly factor BamD